MTQDILSEKQASVAVEEGEHPEQEVLSASESIDDLLVMIVERKAHLLVKPLIEHGKIVDREFARRVLTDFGTLARREYSTSLIALVRLMIAEGARNPDLRKRVYEAGPAAVAFELQKLFSDAHEAGILKVPDSHLAAEQLLGLLREPLYQALKFNSEAPSTIDEKEPVMTSVDLVLDGCAKPEGS